MTKRTLDEIKTIRGLIAATQGRWFTITFVKRTDGTLRTMTCRTGVKKYVNGVGMKYDPKSRNLQGVFVANEGKEGAEAYRMVDLEGVIEINAEGKHIQFAA